MANKRRRLLIVNPNQFGYAAGYHYYCKYLKDRFDINFICFDKGFEKVEIAGVNVIYLNYRENKIKRLLNFIWFVIRFSRKQNFNTLLTVNFKLVFLIGLLGRAELKILDNRTGSLKSNKFSRWLINRSVLFSSLFFHKIMVLSESLKQLLKLPSKKTFIVPLGAEVIDDSNKVFNKMHLIYIGTFTKRNIDITIKSFIRFYKEFSNDISCKYNIIGFGAEEKQFYEMIESAGLASVIKVHSRKNHNQLKEFLSDSTIGVAFVPQTAFYQVQPSTKIFEYALSGLITIATDTKENNLVINDENGIICQDTADGFYEALIKVYEDLGKYNSSKIRNSLDDYRWESIINNIIFPEL